MFRFTIRELALLTTVVGLGTGWWLDHTRLSTRVTFLEFGANELIEIENMTVEVNGKPWPGTQQTDGAR